MYRDEEGAWRDLQETELIGQNIDTGWSGPPILIVSVGDGAEVPISGTAPGAPKVYVRVGTLTRADYSNYPGPGAEPIPDEFKKNLSKQVFMYNPQGERILVGAWKRME